MVSREKSARMFEEATQYTPGGVNSPARTFRAVGGTPFFVDRAEGAYVYDLDGNPYVDYVGTWGPAILGHAHPKIVKAVQEKAALGTSFGIPNPLEVTMAKRVCEAVPSVEKVRMVNSGTEATMSAIRLARGYTNRDKIIKFEGCYHGHVDSLLVKAGSGALTVGSPNSAGVPAAFTEHTVVLPFNDEEAVKQAFETYKGEIAGIILEPVPANSGLYPPKPGYLDSLREITRREGALLIFDEVMTGFRLAWGGAQEVFGVSPDLSCFGKIIGGGLPVGAFGGRDDIMDQTSPTGPVYQAGTLSGNPLAMAAGITALEELRSGEAYQQLEKSGAKLEEGILDAAKQVGLPVQINRLGSMFCLFFTDSPVRNFNDATKSDRDRFAKFFHGMLDRGVYLAPSQFETGFLSTAHKDDEEIEKTIRVVREVFKEL